MPKILKLLFRPIVKLRATARKNAVIYANLSQEDLRELQRQRKEINDACERYKQTKILYGPIGWRL